MWQTGFSQGTPDISNDDELAAEVAGFLTQFFSIFEELKPKNFYVTGESVCLLPFPLLVLELTLLSVCWLL